MRERADFELENERDARDCEASMGPTLDTRMVDAGLHDAGYKYAAVFREAGNAQAEGLVLSLLSRIHRLEGERSALIGQRIVEDAVGRGWWAYAEPPEDAQGFPMPSLYPTWDEAVRSILATMEPSR